MTPALTTLWHVQQQRAPDLAAQSSRVAWLSGRIADLAGLDPAIVAGVQLAGQFYAVGRLTLPVALRYAPGPHTAAEWARLQRVPALSAQAVRDRGAGAAAAIIAQQGEHWDGSGDLCGLVGTAIHPAARVLAVAVAVVTACSDPCYRGHSAYATALDVLAGGAGRQFDPALVRLVTTLWPAPRPPAPLLFAPVLGPEGGCYAG